MSRSSSTYIETLDDDATASSVNDLQSPMPARKCLKRKPSADFEEKVTWTDEDEPEESVKSNLQRASKRRATGKGQAAGKKGSGQCQADKQNISDDDCDAFLPDYLQKRRREFNQKRELLHNAALKLPPDYSEIYFSDDERDEPLEVRPRFDETSGIKPCRPYEDIELEYSGGIIPAPIAQYLRDYQIAGVKFLHQRFVYQKGCILGDDMGLGKTVQVVAFLAAAFGKTGDERDTKRMRKMRRAAGDLWYPRVLIVCPGSLIRNWYNELSRWGWWHADIYHGSGKDDVLAAAKAGRLEIMITTYTTYKNMHQAVNTVEWDCVVADECHVLKDLKSETTQSMNCVNALCRIGLTGTAIQNKYEELWTLLNWTNPGKFGTRADWDHAISKPLKVGQSHDATLKELSLARSTAKKLVYNLLPDFFLRRMKTLIADQLPKKTDKVVFCPLTTLQREAYENFLDSEQIEYIISASDPCDCGSGRKSGWCCHKTLPDGRSWRSVVFPSIVTLQKIANHLTLLVPTTGDPRDKQETELANLRTCLPEGWEEMYRNRDSMVNLANPEFCGKWKVLRKLLRFWHEHGDKVLVFSHSVRLLRILQCLFQNTSYNVSFLDGSLSYEDRQKAVDDFNSDPQQFVFLISTKAGGMGLNITSANKVVIFDPHWNPSHDLQAQDRAYRIGQSRDVDVFRLVSAGTIEEIVYARQIYKQQQANIGYNASTERRYFKGVQEDKHRRGEIFGLHNLFSFHADQVVLRDIVNKTNIAEAKAGVLLSDIDVNLKDDDDDALSLLKQEDGDNSRDDEHGGMAQLAKLLTAENQEELIRARKASKPRTDAIAAILASAGVEYTHENSEVIGSSRVEAQLSRKAELVADVLEGDSALFTAVHHSPGIPDRHGGGDVNYPWKMHYRFKPPKDVMLRQFCSMAKEFGFESATDFALVVESWSPEQRRNCLDLFYKIREVKVLEKEVAQMKAEDEAGGDVREVKDGKTEDAKKKPEEDSNKGPNATVQGNREMREEGSLKQKGVKAEVQDKKLADTEEFSSKAPTPAVRMEKTEQRRTTMIFLSDDDEDDEL